MKNEDFKVKWKNDVKVCRELLNHSIPEVPDRELSIDDAAKKLGVSKQTLRNWEHSGKISSTRTDGGHRRYMESDINRLKGIAASIPELVLPGVKVSRLREIGETLLANFDETELIYLTVSQSNIDGKVRIMADSMDGLTTVKTILNMEE